MVISNAPVRGGSGFPVTIADGWTFLMMVDTRSNSGSYFHLMQNSMMIFILSPKWSVIYSLRTGNINPESPIKTNGNSD